MYKRKRIGSNTEPCGTPVLSRVELELDWLFNVTINDISVIHVTAHRCAGGPKKKLDLRSGSHVARSVYCQYERFDTCRLDKNETVCVLCFHSSLISEEETDYHSAGGWSDWGQWTSCTVPCGSGIRSRERTCDNPKPKPHYPCYGEPMEEVRLLFYAVSATMAI